LRSGHEFTNGINNGMSGFGWKTGAGRQETFRFSKACDAIAVQIRHVQGTSENAARIGVKILDRGVRSRLSAFSPV